MISEPIDTVAEALVEPELQVTYAYRPVQLSVVVPTFNERDNISLLVDRLRVVLAEIDWEVVFVDDDSPDGTADRVRTIAQTDPRVRCIQRIGGAV
jgi:dolichol-phosphate mannosyltransferase